MSLFYETGGVGFDKTLKKKKETPQKTETKAPYKEQIPHLTEIVPKSTTTTNKKTTSSPKKSSSSSSKKNNSSSSKTSSSKAPYKEQLPSIFTINQRIGSNNSSGNRNTSSNKSNRFSGSSAFGSTIFQPNLTSTTKKAKSSNAKTSGNSPVQLYKTKGNPSFYNDYQMRSSTNKRFAPYAAAFNKPKTINDVIQNATNGNIFSKKPDIISNDKELTDEAKTYIEKGMQTANVLDNSFVKGEKPGYYMSYEVNSPIMRLALNSDQRMNDLANKDVIGFNAKDYMTEDELYTFYYINGRDGYSKSKEYVDSLEDELKRRAFYNGSAVQNLQNANPATATVATLGAAVVSPGEGISTAIKSLRGKTVDYTDNQNAAAIRELQKSSEKINNPIGKVFSQAVIGLARNAPEMFANYAGKALGSETLGQVAGAILGVDSSIADKYAEQIENGTVAVKGSTADIVAAGVIGGVEWGLMGKGISAPLNLLKSTGAKTALKDFAINTANNFLTGAGITVAQTTLENIADTVFLKDNSPYQQLAKDYIESGMSEEEAYNQAFKETYLTPLISSAAVGGLTGGVMALPGNISISADYTARGRNIKQNGNFNDTIRQGLTYEKSTDAYKNAEQLSKKLTSGKLISDSELGAQDVLNNIEAEKTQLYAQAYEKLTGQSIYRAQGVDNEINAYNRNGNIIISDNIDEPATALIRHEGAHGIEQAAPERYSEYTNALRNQQGFSEYVDRLKRTYEDAGLEYNDKTLESEAAADFAKNFLKDTKSVEQLSKVASEQTKLIDRVYNGISDLYAKLKAKGGKTFVDENTGIRVSADELYNMKKSFESALLEAKENGYNDNSIMYSIKQNYDAAKYSVKIDSELTSYLNSIGINKKIFTSADKSEIKDTIRQAYKMLDEGNVNDAEQILKEAGEYLTKKDPKAKKEDIPIKFAENFIELYNVGKENNSKKETARLNYQDKKNYNMSVSRYINELIRSENSDIDNDTAKDISDTVRSAYSDLKSGGSREKAIQSIADVSRKILENSKTKIPYENAESVLSQIRSANVDLSAFKDNTDGNIKEAYKGLTKVFKSSKKGGIPLDAFYDELSNLYPEYFTKDVSSPEDILQRINDVYYQLRYGESIPTYRNSELENASRLMAEQIVDEYYNKQPAKAETDTKISQQDINKYGIDIESQFRGSGFDITESDVKSYSEYIRNTVDNIVKSLNDSINSEKFIEPAAKKYEDYAADFNKEFNKLTKNLDIEAVEKENIAAKIMDSIWVSSDNAISNVQRRAQDLISYYDINKKAPDGTEITDVEYKKAKKVLELCKNKSKEISGLKLSKTYSNTAQKDFFLNGTKNEFENRKKDFYYEGITNKETYENAVKSIDLNGREKTILSLTTKENWTAEDMAKVAALVARYQSEGKYSDAADIYILAREKATNSGQVIQSMRLFDKLSPQGKLIAFESDYNKAIENQINNRADKKELKEKIKKAKEKDAENRKPDDQQSTKRQDNIKERAKLSDEIENNKKEIDNIENLKKKVDSNADEIRNNKKEISDIENKLKKINEKNKKKIDELNNKIDILKENNSQLFEEIKKLKAEYDQKRPQLEKLVNRNKQLQKALSDLEKKYTNLKKKADKSIVDVYTELDKVLNEAGVDHIPENILRYMRTSFAILPALNDADTIADLIIDQSRVRKTAAGKNIKRALKNAAKRHGVEMLRETAYNQLFNMIGDFMPHSISSKVGFWLRAAMLLNSTTLIRNVLSNFVFTPVETFVNNMAVPIDMFVSLFAKQRSIGFEMPFTGYINGIRRAKLSRLEQALKVNNLLNSGNEYATPKRTLYSKAGSAVERVMGYGLSSTDEYQKGIVEQRVRKNLERINKKYSRKQNDQETEVEIDGSKLNDNINLDDYDLNYEFEISEFDPEYEVIEKTKKAIIDFHKYGFSPEDIDEVVQYEMLYRTFQDDTALSRALKGLQETGNKLLSVGKFGLGDLNVPFVQVPGNIISRSIEYSPLGYFKFISNIASIAKDNHSRHSRITPAQQRKIILSLTRPTTALGLMAAGAFLRQNNIIIGNSINNEEDYDYTNYQKAKGISDFLINLSALERLIKGEDTSPQNNDNLMDIGWLSPLNATFALGASLSDLFSPNLNVSDINNLQDLKDMPEQLFNTTKENFWEILNNVFQYGIEQARDLPALTGIYQITQNWENVNGQILPFLAAQGTDMALGFIPQVVKKAGNVIDTETRYPYKEENPYQIAIGKIYSALPFMQKRQEVPKKVDVFGDEVKSTLGETWKDIVNEYIAPGKFSTYKEKDIVPELDRLLQYSSDILPESPYTENSTTIDGVKYSFTVKGKDYEEFSKLLGTVTYDNISAFMGSDYYQYLSDNQRVENISTIVSESKKLASQIWVKASQGTSIDEINEMKSSKAAEYKAIPAYTVKERQAKDYLMSDSAPVETLVDGYVKRYSTDWTEEEKNKKIQEYQKKINDIKAGKRYKEINGKKVYSRYWSADMKEEEISKAQDQINRINNGEAYKQDDITGVWSELTEEAQQQALKNLEKNIEELELPEAAISTIPDMSQEAYYTESTNTGIQDFENKSALYETRFGSDNVFKPSNNYKAESTDTPSQYDLAYIADQANEYNDTETSKSPQKYNKSRYTGSSSGKSSKKSSYSRRKRSSGGGSGGGSSGGGRTAYSIASLLNTPRFTPRSSTNSYVMPGYQAEDEYYNNGIQVASAMSYRPRFTPREQIFTGSRYQSGTRFPDRFNRA